jgi:hypothetical protein
MHMISRMRPIQEKLRCLVNLKKNEPG